jgi:hypothetical protein
MRGMIESDYYIFTMGLHMIQKKEETLFDIKV